MLCEWSFAWPPLEVLSSPGSTFRFFFARQTGGLRQLTLYFISVLFFLKLNRMSFYREWEKFETPRLEALRGEMMSGVKRTRTWRGALARTSAPACFVLFSRESPTLGGDLVRAAWCGVDDSHGARTAKALLLCTHWRSWRRVYDSCAYTWIRVCSSTTWVESGNAAYSVPRRRLANWLIDGR